MHVLIARAPGGTTHAVSCKTSAEFGVRFTRTMEVQRIARTLQAILQTT